MEVKGVTGAKTGRNWTYYAHIEGGIEVIRKSSRRYNYAFLYPQPVKAGSGLNRYFLFGSKPAASSPLLARVKVFQVRFEEGQ